MFEYSDGLLCCRLYCIINSVKTVPYRAYPGLDMVDRYWDAKLYPHVKNGDPNNTSKPNWGGVWWQGMRSIIMQMVSAQPIVIGRIAIRIEPTMSSWMGMPNIAKQTIYSRIHHPSVPIKLFIKVLPLSWGIVLYSESRRTLMALEVCSQQRRYYLSFTIERLL